VGELGAAYGLGVFAFVGRSLMSAGGHNMLEPAALGVPPLFGPHTDNFAEESKLLLATDAAGLVEDEEDLYNSALRLVSDLQTRRRMGDAGKGAVLAQRGATERHLGVISEALGSASGDPDRKDGKD